MTQKCVFVLLSVQVGGTMLLSVQVGPLCGMLLHVSVV